MITIKLMGGLGNQMFQYACGRALSIKSGQKLCLDISRFQRDKIYNRKYLLNHFEICYEKLIKPSNRTLDSVIDRVEKVIKKNEIIYEPRIEIESEHKSQEFLSGYPVYTFTEHEKTFYYQKNVILDGLWQSEKYFKEINEIIKKEFSLEINDKKLINEYAALMQSNNSVCIGIRRYKESGAYKKHYTVNVDYYKKAVDIISQKIDSPKFFIFTLDEEWAKEELSFLQNPVFIKPGLSDVEIINELILMSKAKSFIIPNSTYHWWGAWLSNYNNKIVIAPRLGWGNKYCIPDEWITIG